MMAGRVTKTDLGWGGYSGLIYTGWISSAHFVLVCVYDDVSERHMVVEL